MSTTIASPPTSWSVEIHDDLPSATYHARTDRISNSMRKVFRQSPEWYEAMFISQSIPRQPTTKAMLFGVSVHRLVLEGAAQTIVQIPPDKLTKAGAKHGKAWEEFAQHCAERDVTPLKEDEYAALLAVQQAIAAHPVARQVMFDPNARYERSIFWTDEDTALPLRCRLDVQADRLGVIADLKCLHDVSPSGFSRAAHQLGYDSQQYLYRQGVLAACGADYSFAFICVCAQHAPNILVECYELDKEFQGLAESATRRDLEQLATCYRSGVWRAPGWGRIKTVAPPSFARYAHEWEYEA